MTDMQTEDPATIEREIRATQDRMSSTIDRIGDQLNVKTMFNALLDKADESNVDARMVLDGARRNPVALGMIAIGAIWLISEKDSKIPSFKGKSGKGLVDRVKSRFDHHYDYTTHMSAVEQRADEDVESYQRRRDIARSNFFMVERGHEEDDKGFRARLDAVAEGYRNKRRAIGERSGQLMDSSRETAAMAKDRAGDAFMQNPLVGGMIAAAVGALVGAALPVTQTERGKLGSIGGRLREKISAQTDQATSKLREKKDDMLQKADDALKPSGEQGAGTDEQPVGGSQASQLA